MNVRTRRIAVTVAVLAVAVTPAAFSKSAASPNYVLQVDFGVGLETTWSDTSGDPAAECTGWSKVTVTNEVNAKSGPRPPSRVYTIRGLFTNFDVLPKKARDQIIRAGGLGWRGWDFSAVGFAHGTIDRRRVETGQDKSCATGTPVVTPLRPPPNDCGHRSFTTRTATLKAGWRKSDGTLKSLGVQSEPGYARHAIVFSVQPDRSPYRQCDAGGAPEFPFGVGLVLPGEFVRYGLVRMKVGDIRKYDHQYGGDCDKDIEPPARCTFGLELNVRIKRTH